MVLLIFCKPGELGAMEEEIPISEEENLKKSSNNMAGLKSRKPALESSGCC